MILLISVLFGLSIVLIVWWIHQILTDVPIEDRTYLDQPPKGFKLFWPLVRLIVYYIGPLLKRDYRIRLSQRLRKAGMEFSLSPEQFFAGKVIGAVLAALLAYLVISMLKIMSPFFLISGAVMGFYYPEIWLKEVTDKRQRAIFKALPFYIDVIILSVEAGTNMTGALTHATQKAPSSPLKSEINRVLRDVRAGKSRAASLRSMADRIEMSGINSLVSSIIQAEKTGSSLGPILRAQADQRRTERFQKAEKQAMEAPVKLLGPLIMFIFPNTFLVIGFVLVVKAVESGALPDGIRESLTWALTWPG